MAQFSQYQTTCKCGRATTKKYAREHNGQCKSCVTGEDQTRLHICPDCGERRLTDYQKLHRYHCDVCTREADPQGYVNEVMGYND